MMTAPVDEQHTADPFISVEAVSKVFGEKNAAFTALQGISLAFARNSFTSLVGHSGCGKSTLLRILAGLEPSTSGEVTLGGCSPRQYGKGRQLGFVFQDSALLSWKTTLQNVRLPLDILKTESLKDRDARAREFIRLVRLEGFEDRYPAHLSGGMRQRASIARSLSFEPEVLLMDEPFGALDDFTRREMGDELLRIWSERQCTVVFVTHSLQEAVLLSDNVVVLDSRPGRVRRIVPIDLPRPRDGHVRESPEFADYVKHLEHLIFGDRL